MSVRAGIDPAVWQVIEDYEARAERDEKGHGGERDLADRDDRPAGIARGDAGDVAHHAAAD